MPYTDVHGHETWGHGGRIPGFASDLFHLPKERMTVAVVTNDEGWPLEETAAELIYAAIEREPQWRGRPRQRRRVADRSRQGPLPSPLNGHPLADLLLVGRHDDDRDAERLDPAR